VRALGDVIAFCPPLVISDAEIRAITGRFGEALDAAAAKLS
jgi:4-aminobutyrate--pyruvate transaminase